MNTLLYNKALANYELYKAKVEKHKNDAVYLENKIKMKRAYDLLRKYKQNNYCAQEMTGIKNLVIFIYFFFYTGCG